MILILTAGEALMNFEFEMPEGEKEIEVAYGTIKRRI